ncbi:MAG: hypothetical protein ACOX0U_03285 [Oscillospiraceae bacterium]
MDKLHIQWKDLVIKRKVGGGQMHFAIGKSIERKDAWDKVTGNADYTDDLPATGILSARLLTSTCAHAVIQRIDISKALAVQGVNLF